MSKFQIALNADLGESFGNYRICNDEEFMKYISSVNLACGFHAGDPVIMRNSVKAAIKNGVSIGAHPGFNDKQGFGRRMINISEDELYCDIMYQLGALDAFVKSEKAEMTHVCPHGVMDTLVSENESYADAFINAVIDYNKNLKLVIEEKSLLASKCKLKGIRVASVGYPDLKYDKNGNMIITRSKEIMNIDEITEQAIRMVKDNKYKTVDGNYLPIKPDVLCFHSDVPNSIEIIQKVRKAFELENIEIINL